MNRTAAGSVQVVQVVVERNLCRQKLQVQVRRRCGERRHEHHGAICMCACRNVTRAGAERACGSMCRGTKNGRQQAKVVAVWQRSSRQAVGVRRQKLMQTIHQNGKEKERMVAWWVV